MYSQRHVGSSYSRSCSVLGRSKEPHRIHNVTRRSIEIYSDGMLSTNGVVGEKILRDIKTAFALLAERRYTIDCVVTGSRCSVIHTVVKNLPAINISSSNVLLMKLTFISSKPYENILTTKIPKLWYAHTYIHVHTYIHTHT